MTILKRMSNTTDEMSDDDDDGRNQSSQELMQCSLCLRRMRKEVFVKHPNLCHKNSANKRTVHVFDMARYRSVKAGDNIVPICKVSPIKSNNITRPSQTRSAKRDRRSDTFVPPLIENFCTY
jgi:hypothetical protein